MLDELQVYLNEIIVPIYLNLIEDGQVKYDVMDGKLITSQENSSVQISRYLWFFSSYYIKCGDVSILEICNQLYDNLINTFKVNDGYIISTNNQEYHVYYNAFVLYGLSEYYLVTKSSKVLSEINDLHNFIESNFYNKNRNMYHEQLDVRLCPVTRSVIDFREGGYSANSIIHLLEAYTNVVKVTENYQIILKRILDILFERFYEQAGYFVPYITNQMKVDSSYISYGHDIETVWLVGEALNVLKIDILMYKDRLLKVYDNVIKYGLAEDGFIKMQSDQSISTWWSQVEAIVGFTFCSVELENKNKNAQLVYEFTKNYYMTSNGLYNEIDSNRKIINTTIANIWKTPYHDGRMMLKMIAYLESEA